MAGICGVIGAEDKELIQKMASLMEHRGELINVLADDSVTIAVIRRNHEPELYNDGSTFIALDQDIYAIGDCLIDNDSDINAHLTSDIYEDAVKKLRGSFALSIFQRGKGLRKLILARDIFGTRSMYYLQIEHALFFASEMKCFLAIAEFNPEVNLNALSYYLTCGFTPNRETLLNQVYKVLPAEIVQFEDGNLNYTKYWMPRAAEQEPLDPNYWSEHAWANLLNTTKAMLPAKEHKVGITLSGGIDSSLIAAALRHADDSREVLGFSLDYGHNDNPELRMAEDVAKYFDIDFHIVQLNPEQFVENLEGLQWIYDEPLIKFSFIPTYYLFDAASKHVKTLFTGDGGDEQFIGYRSDYWEDPLVIKFFSKLGHIKRPLLSVGNNVARPMARLTRSKMLSLATEFSARNYASHAHWQYRIASRVFQGDFAEEELPSLIPLNSPQGITDAIVELIDAANSCNAIEKISHAMLTSKLPDDLLRLDKSVASTGVKARAPLLDPKMTNFNLSIPIQLRYQNKTTKYLIRYLSKKYGLLPEKVVDTRVKRGLTAPIYQWLTRSSSREYFDDLMESGINSLNIDEDFVRRFWPPKTYTETIKSWNLIALSLWVKTFHPK